MLALLIQLSLAKPSRLQGADCTWYQCWNGDSKGYCAVKNTTASQMWFSECGDGTPCDISAPTKTTDNDTIQYYNCTGTNNIPNAQAGGFCNTSNDCVNSLPCQNSICVGQEKGQSCTSTSECVPGYYCNDDLKCEESIPIGQACNSDQQCGQNAVCRGIDVSNLNNRTCVQFGSIKNYAYLSSCIDQFALGSFNDIVVDPVCESFSCKNYMYAQNIIMAQCIPAVKTSNTDSCSSNNDCIINFGKSKIDGQCECSNASLDSKICLQLAGNSQFEDFISYIKQWISSGSPACNNFDKFSTQCIRTQGQEKYTQYMGLIEKALHQNFIKENQQCVAKTLYPYYFQLSNMKHSNSKYEESQ